MEGETHQSFDDDQHSFRGAALWDVPRPLQIIKKRGKEHGHQGRTRHPSSGIEESLGSVPEPPGGDRPIAIPKRSCNRGDLIFGGPTKENIWPLVAGHKCES